MDSQPSNATPTAGTVLTFLAMTVVCMAIVIGMCVRLAQELEPGVGDIAEFVPGRTAQDLLSVNVTAQDGSHSCVLASDVIARTGGSFVVVARQPQQGASYLIHWVGPHTSTGASDCGASADLVVSKHDLLSLAGMAGGFGIHPEWHKST
ncbi:MAG TPA: hypothetical protein VK726_00415 [Acetobacteraceae bacterium]|jgi:hypothetical protein|nr:hypothetical protein [Acetobacteraceae bacterium]